jgi:hypothetical protein
MMSTDTKLRQASSLRSDATEDGRESRGSPPVGCPYRLQKSAPDVSSQILQFKGLAGGVPLNTETAAVKPRVGIE